METHYNNRYYRKPYDNKSDFNDERISGSITRSNNNGPRKEQSDRYDSNVRQLNLNNRTNSKGRNMKPRTPFNDRPPSKLENLVMDLVKRMQYMKHNIVTDLVKQMQNMKQTMNILVDNSTRNSKTIETNGSRSESNGLYGILDHRAPTTVMGKGWFENYLNTQGLTKGQIQNEDKNKICGLGHGNLLTAKEIYIFF